jgi:hypothetical protein
VFLGSGARLVSPFAELATIPVAKIATFIQKPDN